MLIVLQFPLSDTRPFVAGRQHRRDVPNWWRLETDVKPEFVHSFGKAVKRRQDPDGAWTDEGAFCLARRGLRFDSLATQKLGPESIRMRPAMAFRRLLSDGNTVVRIEIGLTHNRTQAPLGALDTASVLQVAKDACSLPTWVPDGRHERPWKALLHQGRALADLYAHASQRKVVAPDMAPLRQDVLVRPGRPLLLIEVPRDQRIDVPEGFVALDPAKTRRAQLSFGRLATHAGVVSTWLLHRHESTRVDVRSLRLCLMRLHAEQECLDIAIQQVQARRIPVAEPDGDQEIQDLNEYFNDATHHIQRASWGGVSQSAILEAYDAAEQVTPNDARVAFSGRFEGAKRQVSRKIEDYQVRRAAVRYVSVTTVSEGATYVEKQVVTNVSGQGNIVNVAEYMNNVSNVVNQRLTQSTAPTDAQELVKTLTRQIQELSTRIEPQKTQQMGADVETLAKEMAQPEPRRAWYELSLKGLQEAAEAVGAIGKPIVDTVKLLWPLLLP